MIARIEARRAATAKQGAVRESRIKLQKDRP